MKTVEIPSLASSDFTCASTLPLSHLCSHLTTPPDVSTPLILWSAAESGATIIAASIPVLRTLFRDLNQRSKRYYLSGSKSGGTHSRTGGNATARSAQRPSSRANPNNINTVTIVSAGEMPHGEKNHSGVLSSKASDTMPLRDSYGQILQSTEIVVAVEFKGDKESDGDSHELSRV